MKTKELKHSVLWAAMLWIAAGGSTYADGLVIARRDYKGSLEEQSQEAMIVFRPGTAKASAVEDLILKIQVSGAADEFAWVVPLPNQPETAKADPKLFHELFDYVETRRLQRQAPKKGKEGFGGALAEAAKDVDVLSREIVGSYDVAVVRERKAGTLNGWLETEGYQRLEGGEDVIGFYRDKGYVFTCIKVSDAAIEGNEPVDLHPLRFTFETGGRDGIYFPMRMTGLQSDSFMVNLYVFYQAWLNDRLNKFGYTHRGFTLEHRDWDTRRCKPNAGKTWSQPARDPFLADVADTIPTLTRFFRDRHPHQRFYLTNIKAVRVNPVEVRQWPDDLWMFPYYVNRRFVPYDARAGGPAEAWAQQKWRTVSRRNLWLRNRSASADQLSATSFVRA